MRSPISLAAVATLFMLAVAVHSSAQGSALQAQGRGGRAGGGRATFPAQQRPPGDPVLIARGNGLYGVHCRACHGVDLRGGDQGGPNLLRSDLVLNDQAGELIAPVILNGQQRVGSMPPIRVTQDDARAIAEYIRSVTATMRGQGNPPPGPDAVLNVLVGDAAAGEMYFNAKCGACHSTTGDLRGIGSRLSDPTTLQNYWISGGGGLGRGGRGRPIPVSVTSATGQKVDGTACPALEHVPVTHVDGDGKMADSFEAMRRHLRTTKSKRMLVGAINDPSALGALRADQESGRTPHTSRRAQDKR